MKLTLVNKMFAFSFGGSQDFGREYKIGNDFELDFTPKPVGIGLAVRDGIEADISNAKKITFKLLHSGKQNAVVELKTKNSGNAPEVSQEFVIRDGNARIFTVSIPKLSSDLKEIVIFFPREKNDFEKEEIELIDFYIE